MQLLYRCPCDVFHLRYDNAVAQVSKLHLFRVYACEACSDKEHGLSQRPLPDAILFLTRKGENMSSTIEQIEAVAGAGSVRQLFEKQKAYFLSDVTKSYEWRVDQLDRLIRMLKRSEERR